MRVIATIVGLFLGGVVLLTNGPTVHAQEQQDKPKPVKKAVLVTVESGDSLSKIGKKHDTTYLRIFYANKSIQDPDVIHPGDKLRIPAKEEKLKERALPQAAVAAPASSQVAYTAPAATYQQPVAAPAPAPVVSAAGGGVWDQLAACESGGNWAINTGNGYYGGLQFSLSSWRGVGGSGYPHQASKAEQISRGEMLRASGGWGHWPACSAKLGLR
jgi:LysM repeat protein